MLRNGKNREKIDEFSKQCKRQIENLPQNLNRSQLDWTYISDKDREKCVVEHIRRFVFRNASKQLCQLIYN